MKQSIFFLFFLTLITGVSFSQNITRIYDPYAVQRDVEPFHQLHVSGAFKVIIKQGGETGVAVSSENIELRDAIQTKVQNGVLRVQLTGSTKINLKGKSRLVVYVSVKDIDSILLSGACTLVVDGKLNTDKLGIAISGASSLNAELQVKNLNICQSGASDLDLNGNVEQLVVKLSGASDLKAIDLMSVSCFTEISGASDMQIAVSQKLNAIVSGASELQYSGKPVFSNVKSSGASTIKQINK